LLESFKNVCDLFIFETKKKAIYLIECRVV